MTPIAKGVVTLGGETALLAAAVTIDVDPAAILVGAGSLAGGAFLWVAQGWWKDWRDDEAKYRAEMKADLKAIRADLDSIKERHNREDGAAQAAADARRQR